MRASGTLCLGPATTLCLVSPLLAPAYLAVLALLFILLQPSFGLISGDIDPHHPLELRAFMM